MEATKKSEKLFPVVKVEEKTWRWALWVMKLRFCGSQSKILAQLSILRSIWEFKILLWMESVWFHSSVKLFNEYHKFLTRFLLCVTWHTTIDFCWDGHEVLLYSNFILTDAKWWSIWIVNCSKPPLVHWNISHKDRLVNFRSNFSSGYSTIHGT